VQANGAEMFRLAWIFATEAGIEVCAGAHDAFLICAPLDRLEHDIDRMRACMARASKLILNGFEIRTDVSRTLYPDRYHDPRGVRMWNVVMELITKRTGARSVRVPVRSVAWCGHG
jgi:hypothetical protein